MYWLLLANLFERHKVWQKFQKLSLKTLHFFYFIFFLRHSSKEATRERNSSSARTLPHPHSSLPTVHSSMQTNNKATKRKSKEQSNAKMKKKGRKRKALFVVKLFQFLMSDDQHVDVVSWYKDSSFVIWDRDLFEATVLPLLFSHNKYASFERQVNFYNFAKMSIHEEFPTTQRIGKKDPIKYKHRMFYKGASLEQVQSIKRSTSPHQIQELQATIESVNEQIALIIENKRIVREKIAKARQVLLTLPLPATATTVNDTNEIPATTVNDTNDIVVEAATGNDEPANVAVRVAPEETNTQHRVPASGISFEFEMQEPNGMSFFGVPIDGMALNSVFDTTI